ncbi:hypothetical protein D3C72_1445360 [compost metagenome]
MVVEPLPLKATLSKVTCTLVATVSSTSCVAVKSKSAVVAVLEFSSVVAAVPPTLPRAAMETW